MNKFNFNKYLISSGFDEDGDILSSGAFSIEIEENDTFILVSADRYIECAMSKNNADICIKIAKLFNDIETKEKQNE